MTRTKVSSLLLLLLTLSFTVNSEVIHSERSLYRDIIVEDNNDLRCLKFNTKQSKTNQSCLFKSKPEQLVFNYTKLLFSSLLLIDAPKSVLIIGLGGGTMSNTLHELYPNAIIDNVEIDPAVIKVAKDYFYFSENEQVNAYAKDGRIFIKRAAMKKQKYDWIILDAFNGDYIPEHLLTAEFLTEVKSILSPKGVLSANTFSISRLYQHESATYHQVFGDFYNVKNRQNANRIILTQITPSPASRIKMRAEKLAQPLAKYNIDINAILANMTSTKDKHDWPKDTRILTDQFSPANLLNYVE